MNLEKIMKRLFVPMVVGAIAFTSMQCKTADDPESSQPQEKNISYMQNEISKPGSNNDSPKIRYTFVPEERSYSNIKGMTYNTPGNTMVAGYVHAAGSWWVKPYYAYPLTPINPDGTFEFDYTTGGVDEFADSINSYLVRSDFIPPSNSLPDMNNPKVLAGVTICRE